MFATVKTVHDIGQALTEIQKTLSSASVMGNQGTIEASVELRDNQQERLATEKAEWERFLGLQTTQADPDETSDSASHGTGPDETSESA
jgi:hypothetical protein